MKLWTICPLVSASTREDQTAAKDFIRKPHRYRFTVYALDIMLDISPDSNKEKLVNEMCGHTIEKAELVGIYDPVKKNNQL